MGFNIGDVVKLKSGGKAMTVIKVDDGFVVCSFWDKDRYYKELFKPACLVIVDQ
jgi:uncharacterized protein YodC (DUF2158 family)